MTAAVKLHKPELALPNAIDEMGKLKAQMDDLQARYNELRQQVIDSGQTQQHGKLFAATVVTSTVTRVDYKTVIEGLPPSAKLTRLLNTNTKTQHQVTVRITSR